MAGERMTVCLTSRTSDELREIQDRQEVSKTDAIRRSVSLYHMVMSELDQDRELVIRDRRTGEHERIHFL